MKITFASDLHGQPGFYKQVFEAAWRERVGAVVLGGDLLPHGPAGTSDPEADVAHQKAFAADVIGPILRKFRRLVPGAQTFYIHGNHDWVASAGAMTALEDEGLWHGLHGQHVTLPGGYELIGWGNTSPSPFPIKDRERLDRPGDPLEFEMEALISSPDGRIRRCPHREYVEELPTLEEELATLPAPNSPANAVLVLHQPPRGTNCDVLFDGRHIGSAAVRALVERVGPRLVLCGHIHESPYKSSSPYDKIGGTVVCNPGQGELKVHQVTLDLARPASGIQHSIFGTEFPFTGGPIQIGPASE